MTSELSPEIREQGGYQLIEKLITSNDVSKINTKLATEITRDYKNKNPLFIFILNGALIFGRDLMALVDVGPAGYDTMAISSYGNGTESNHQPVITKDIKVPIEGRNVIVVEDIVDTGWSLSAIKKILESRNPKSLRTCTLLDKTSRREADILIDYVGKQIEDKFVVGYGLDVSELFRLLPDIWVARKTPTT